MIEINTNIISNKEKVVIIGAGGHCRSVLDILLDSDIYEIIGLVDNVTFENYRNIPVIGDDTVIESVFKSGVHKAFVAIGNNTIRKKIYDNMIRIGFEFINVISKNSYVSTRSTIGNGVVIMHGAIVNIDCFLGDGVIVNTNASIDHESCIGHFSHIAPSTTLCGNVNIGNLCLIGAGTKIIENISIGSSSVVGAGSVVIKNFENNVKIAGVPAKNI